MTLSTHASSRITICSSPSCYVVGAIGVNGNARRSCSKGRPGRRASRGRTMASCATLRVAWGGAHRLCPSRGVEIFPSCGGRPRSLRTRDCSGRGTAPSRGPTWRPSRLLPTTSARRTIMPALLAPSLATVESRSWRGPSTKPHVEHESIGTCKTLVMID